MNKIIFLKKNYRSGLRSLGPCFWSGGEGGKIKLSHMVLELVMFRIITDLAQNCVVLKLGSEGSVPEMVKKMMVQFLIQEGG